MNYSKIVSYDICNGTGWRVSLFVSGCSRNCPGCFNPQTHDPCFGQKFTEKTKQLIFNELDKDKISGLSLLGGDPMYPANRKEIIEFCKEVKEKYPNKDIWMWTGYLFNELVNEKDCKDIFKYVDVVIDGPFKQELKDPELKWKGSSNQIVWKIYKQDDSHYLGMSDIKTECGEHTICNIITYLDAPIQYVYGNFINVMTKKKHTNLSNF